MTDLTGDLDEFLATIARLVRAPGFERELEILVNSDAKLELVRDAHDYEEYCLVLKVAADIYARYEGEIEESERVIREKATAVAKADPRMYISGVRVAPAPVRDQNWRAGKYSMDSEELLRELEAERSMLVSVATGGPRIETVNSEYVERRVRIFHALAQRQLSDVNPFGDLWRWYGKWKKELQTYQERREFIAEMYDPLMARIREGPGAELEQAFEPTGWSRVDRSLGEMRRRLGEAETAEQFQAVGFLCRESLISVAQVVYDPARHPIIDGVAVSETDAKRMLEAFLAAELRGGAHETARRHAKAALTLAHELTHKRTAEFRLAAMCAEATIAVINLVAIVSGQRDPESGERRSMDNVK